MLAHINGTCATSKALTNYMGHTPHCIVGYRSRKPTTYSNIGSVASVKAALPLRELKIIVF